MKIINILLQKIRIWKYRDKRNYKRMWETLQLKLLYDVNKLTDTEFEDDQIKKYVLEDVYNEMAKMEKDDYFKIKIVKQKKYKAYKINTKYERNAI